MVQIQAACPFELSLILLISTIRRKAEGMNSSGEGSGSNKRQRLAEEKEEQGDTADAKLSQELREMMGGRTHVSTVYKEEELTRTVLLEWAKKQKQGDVKEVNLISITVQTMGGTYHAVFHSSLQGLAAR
jgi:hypothetical protein